MRVDAGGSFLSYELWPRVLRKRDVSAAQASSAFYQLQYQGRELLFNLTTNPYLLAPGFVSEIRRRSNLSNVHIQTSVPTCHLLGDVQDPELEGGFAAISACDGLVSSLGCMWGGLGLARHELWLVALLSITFLCQLGAYEGNRNGSADFLVLKDRKPESFMCARILVCLGWATHSVDHSVLEF